MQTVILNTAQNISDNVPSYPQTVIIAQMLSIGVEREKKLVGVSL